MATQKTRLKKGMKKIVSNNLLTTVSNDQRGSQNGNGRMNFSLGYELS